MQECKVVAKVLRHTGRNRTTSSRKRRSSIELRYIMNVSVDRHITSVALKIPVESETSGLTFDFLTRMCGGLHKWKASMWFRLSNTVTFSANYQHTSLDDPQLASTHSAIPPLDPKSNLCCSLKKQCTTMECQQVVLF